MTSRVLFDPKQTSEHNPGRYLGIVTLSDSTDIPNDALRGMKISSNYLPSTKGWK